MSTPNEVLVVARISHPRKNVVRVVPAKGHNLAFFLLGDRKGIEVVITSSDGEESWRVKLAPPDFGQTVSIKRDSDDSGTIEVHYVAR